MPKRDLQVRIDTRTTTASAGAVTVNGSTVIQNGVRTPWPADFQITNNGRLIVGNNIDSGARGIISPNGLFGYNNNGIRTFALYFAAIDGRTSGDWITGNPDANYIMYDQAAGTLGLYTAQGAGFIADRTGNLRAGLADGAHMLWNAGTGSLQIRYGNEVRIELDSSGDASFTGEIDATGGYISGDLSVTGRLRVGGDVDGPIVYVGKEENEAEYEYSIIRAHDRDNLANFVVRAGQAEDGGDGFYFMVGDAGDYYNRMTYDPTNGLVVNGTTIQGATVTATTASVGTLSGSTGGAGATSLHGVASGSGDTVGVKGEGKIGVYGDGGTYGVYGVNNEASGYGAYFRGPDYGIQALITGASPLAGANTVAVAAMGGDVGLYASGTYSIVVGSAVNMNGQSIVAADDVEIDGDLNHDGSAVGFFATAPVAQQAHIADLEEAYEAGELDSEAEIIDAINTTNAAFNDLLAAIEAYGLLADS